MKIQSHHPLIPSRNELPTFVPEDLTQPPFAPDNRVTRIALP
jgi:hypothetical protein